QAPATSSTLWAEVPILNTRRHTRARRGLLRALGGMVLAGAALGRGMRPALAADEVARLVDSLAGAGSYKVRLEAASVLTRFKDPRVLPALAHAAANDSNPLVRTVVLRLLARNPGGDATEDRARAAIRRALNDRAPEV